MRESKFNTILKNSFNQYGLTHKIADPVGGTGIQNPMDGYGIFLKYPVYWEAKLIRGGLYSFNFNRIEDHQWANMLRIENDLSVTIPGRFFNLVPVGFYEPHRLNIVMFFKFSTLKFLKAGGQNSIKKKELEGFYNSGFYLPIIYRIDKENEKKIQLIDKIWQLNEVLI